MKLNQLLDGVALAARMSRMWNVQESAVTPET